MVDVHRNRAQLVAGQDGFDVRAPNLLEGREFDFVGRSSDGSTLVDSGIVVDLNSNPPHLYVSDTYNHRVLGYLDVRKVRPGDRADLVIGQADFRRAVVNYPTNDPERPSQQSLYIPTGLALDPDGNLFVADSGNGRVLQFPKPFDQPPAQWVYPRANLVLGQSGFNSKVTDPTQSTMSYPYGIAFAGTNGLVVSDTVHNRVLLFRGKPSELTSGQAAGKVLGQTDFRSFQGGTGDDRMFAPRHISTDTDDRLYVADERNNRVLIFDRATDTATTRASVVLTNLNQPRGIFVSHRTRGRFPILRAGGDHLGRAAGGR